MNELERAMLAHHEAAHAVMALELAWPFDAVSIREAKDRHLGVVLLREPPKPDGPWARRHQAEEHTLISLAGPQGELLTGLSTFTDPTDEQVAIARLQTLDVGAKPSTLTERERNALAIAETAPVANGGVVSDEASALLRETALTSDHALAMAHLSWLRIECARRVFAPQFRAVVDTLVPELLAREVLGGDEVRTIHEEVREVTWTQEERSAQLAQMRREDELRAQWLDGTITRDEYEELRTLVPHELEVWR